MNFSKLWNCKISHRLHVIHPTLFLPPSHSPLFPIVLGKQLFAQTAALAIHRSREAIKKSSQCCVLVYPFLFQHVIPFLCTHIHIPITPVLSEGHTCKLTNSPVTSVMVWWYRDSIFFSKDKSHNCGGMAPLDLGHYWGGSLEEPCNLRDLLFYRFFPYLLQ